jgi:hypothetical protein
MAIFRPGKDAVSKSGQDAHARPHTFMCQYLHI